MLNLLNFLTYKAVGSTYVRVSIDLNEPKPEIFIYKEIVAQKLKNILSFIRVKLSFNTLKSINDQILHPWHEVLSHIELMLRVDFIEIVLEIIETDRVTFLMLAIVLSMLLQTVVGQVNIIVTVIQSIIVWWGPEVAFVIHKDFLLLVD